MLKLSYNHSIMSATQPRTIIANWKMNTTISEGSLLLNRLHKELAGVNGVDIIICPPMTHLFALHRECTQFKSLPKLVLGAQNMSEHEEGAYTGEVSAEMLNGLANYVLIGHSERRKYFDETDIVDAEKISLALRHNIKAVLCVGETQQQRDNGHAKQTVLDQLNVCLSEVTASDLKNILIAYEPVWAIGTGNFAKPAQVEEMLQLIKTTLAQMFHSEKSDTVQLLYGGSTNSSNAQAYLELPLVDGLLVGGASLNYKEFAKIVRTSVTKAGISA